MLIFKEVFKITDEDLNKLEVKAEDSEYWTKCYEFIEQIIDKPYENLSDKQIAWLEDIMYRINDGGV